jgi:hypothetical protein
MEIHFYSTRFYNVQPDNGEPIQIKKTEVKVL